MSAVQQQQHQQRHHHHSHAEASMNDDETFVVDESFVLESDHQHDDDELRDEAEQRQQQQQQPPLSPQSAAAAASYARVASDAADAVCCRICLLDENPDDFISPCRCKGSMRFVHAQCLDQWRHSSSNSKSFFECDQCKFKYRFAGREGMLLLLSSSITRHLLTLLLFVALAVVGGFALKAIDFLCGGVALATIAELQQEAEFELMTETEQQLFIAQQLLLTDADAAAAAAVAANWSWSSFLRVDVVHMVLGVLLMGAGGFVALLASLSTGGNFLLQTFRFNSGGRGYYNNNSSSSNKSSVEGIVVIVILVIGLLRCVTSLYSLVSEWAERRLSEARFMVQNV